MYSRVSATSVAVRACSTARSVSPARNALSARTQLTCAMVSQSSSTVIASVSSRIACASSTPPLFDEGFREERPGRRAVPGLTEPSEAVPRRSRVRLRALEVTREDLGERRVLPVAEKLK